MEGGALSPPKMVSLLLLLIASLLGVYVDTSSASDGAPHIVYGKVFYGDGSIPDPSSLNIHAYIPARPGEMLTEDSIGCGYDNSLASAEGWLWLELGSLSSIWSKSEKLRIIIMDTNESGAFDVQLSSVGSQKTSNLVLAEGDHVGPVASGAAANGSSPLTIPEGVANISITATISDAICGNHGIQKAEMFLDSDPGQGLGDAMDAVTGYGQATEQVIGTLYTGSWKKSASHTVYVRGCDSIGNWGSPHSVVVSVSDPQNATGDLDGNGCVDKLDVGIVNAAKGATASGSSDPRDLDGDGKITGLDARKLVLMCDRPYCARCGDVNGDGCVDQTDLGLVNAARNATASGADDPRDLDGDGEITGLDARKLILFCDKPNCAACQ
ncbi:MAG: dockerin type I domain-containing protein [Syntrophobacteraceae bacterium]